MIERLNSLLRLELAAVAGYQKALRAVKKKAAVRSARAASRTAGGRVAKTAPKPRKTVAGSSGQTSASERIDRMIAGLGDWRGERLAVAAGDGVCQHLFDGIGKPKAVCWRKGSGRNELGFCGPAVRSRFDRVV